MAYSVEGGIVFQEISLSWASRRWERERKGEQGFVPVWALDNYTAGIETKLQRDFQWER